MHQLTKRSRSTLNPNQTKNLQKSPSYQLVDPGDSIFLFSLIQVLYLLNSSRLLQQERIFEVTGIEDQGQWSLFRAFLCQMYLKIRKNAHPFITEGVKNELLFLSISGCCDDFRHSQKASNLIKSNYRLAVRLPGKAKISVCFAGEIAAKLALNKTTQTPANPGSFSECSTAFESMGGVA